MQIAPGVCYGRLDVALAAGLLPPWDGHGATLWSSPAQRCRLIAEQIGTPCLDPRLLELDFGAWEGLPWDDVPRDALDAWAADVLGFAPPGGESGAALVARVTAFYGDLGPGGHVVVSHGGPLKVLAALARDQPIDLLAPPQALGSVVIIPPPSPP